MTMLEWMKANSAKNKPLIDRLKKILTKENVRLIFEYCPTMYPDDKTDFECLVEDHATEFESIEFLEKHGWNDGLKSSLNDLEYHLYSAAHMKWPLTNIPNHRADLVLTKADYLGYHLKDVFHKIMDSPRREALLKEEIAFDKMFTVDGLVNVGSVVATGFSYGDDGDEHYYPFVHITKETKKSYLVTDWRPNHFGPEKFGKLEDHQKWIPKSKLKEKVKNALNSGKNSGIRPWRSKMNWGCPVPLVNLTEDELIQIHKIKDCRETYEKLSKIVLSKKVFSFNGMCNYYVDQPVILK